MNQRIYYDHINDSEGVILVNAYACCPSRGSEHAVGFGWLKQMVANSAVIVITETESALEIADYAKKHSWNSLIIGIDIGETARSKCWNQGDWIFYFYYKIWQVKALIVAASLSLKIRIIWQLNMIGFREPGYLWLLAYLRQIKYIWGPVGGGNLVSLKYSFGMGGSVFIIQTIKNILNILCLLSPSVQIAGFSASRIFVSNKAMLSFFNKGLFFSRNIELQSECKFIDTLPVYMGNSRAQMPLNIADGFIKIAMSGKLVYRKGYKYFGSVLIETLKLVEAYSTSLKVKFLIYGAQDKDFDKSLASEFVDFRGVLSRQSYLEELNKCDIFLHLAIDEAGPVSAFEARRLGLPVVAYSRLGVYNDVSDYPYSYDICDGNGFACSVSHALFKCLMDINEECLVSFPEESINFDVFFGKI